MRRATILDWLNVDRLEISIHALHEESDSSPAGTMTHHWISIHALHEESDRVHLLPDIGRDISIHALHEESDDKAQEILRVRFHFNPRSP